jgi:transposase
VIYCGIDVASKSSYLYVTTKSGRKLMSGEVETTREGFEKRLRRYVRDGLAIAVEAGNQTAWIYKALVEMGAKVTVVNPTKVRMIAESLCKTDKIDAKTLALLLRLDALPHLATIVAAYFETFKALTTSIRDIDRELAACERKDTRAARLQTMPKVGRIAALTFLAAVDDPKRFPSARKLVGYSGLAPTVRSSGERTEYGSITRAGRRELRGVWVQVAHLVAIDTSRATQPLRTWFNRVAHRRGKKTATVALARRLLVIAYHLLREETVYDATRLKRRVA